jgi:hypothetical protein
MKNTEPRLVKKPATATSTDTGQRAPTPKPPLVATLTSYLRLYRLPTAPADGPVTPEEEIQTVEAHVRFHQRQVQVGEALLAKLRETRTGSTVPCVTGKTGPKT